MTKNDEIIKEKKGLRSRKSRNRRALVEKVRRELVVDVP